MGSQPQGPGFQTVSKTAGMLPCLDLEETKGLVRIRFLDAFLTAKIFLGGYGGVWGHRTRTWKRKERAVIKQ